MPNVLIGTAELSNSAVPKVSSSMHPNEAALVEPNLFAVKEQHINANHSFEDYRIDDGVSDGETDLDFHNDMLMKDERTNEVRVNASRSKFATGE